MFVAQLPLALLHLTPVGALGLPGGAHLAARVVVRGARVGRTVDTRGLLVIGLVRAHWTGATLVIYGIQVLTSNADRKVAIRQTFGA